MSNQEFYRGGLQNSNKMNEIEALLVRMKAELKEEIKGDILFSKKGFGVGDTGKENRTECDKDKKILPENELFLEVLGQEILLTMDVDQYNILGQTFRPIFCGKVVEVTNGFITLDPVIIKMSNAPFHRFPTPLSFAIERITNFTPFNCEIQFPIP